MAGKSKATVTPVVTEGDSPTSAASVNAPVITPNVAESFDDFLDKQGEDLAARSQTPKGEPKAEDTPAPEVEAEPEQSGEANPEGEVDTEAEKEENKPTDPVEPEPEGKFEKGVLSKLKEANIPESLQKRIKASFEKEIKNREALADRDAILTTKDAEIEALKAQLSEAGNKATVAPSGPLAHLDTLEKLQEATDIATQNLEWAETRQDFERYFQDDPTADEGTGRTAEQKFQEFKAQQLWILRNSPKQAKVLTKRQELRDTLKKSKPDLFRADHEDAKAFADFFTSDPRTREDADQLAADAILGARIRREEATGNFKYHRIDLQAAKANGAMGVKGSAESNGAHTNGEVNGGRKVTLPTARPVSRIPTKPEGKPRLQQLAEQATNGGHTLDDYLDAQREAELTH